MTVPAGVENGQQMRLSGQGEAGYNGGPYGDLFVVFRVAPSKDGFERDGGTIYSRVAIDYATAVLGSRDLETDPAELPVDSLLFHNESERCRVDQTGNF